MLDNKTFCEGVVEHVLSPGTKEMAMRCLMMARQPTPPEIRAGAKFFGADWRAVCVLTGWLPLEGGEWVAQDDPSFSWAIVRPANRTPRVKGPGSEYWNQELAALALRRSL